MHYWRTILRIIVSLSEELWTTVSVKVLRGGVDQLMAGGYYHVQALN